MTYAQLKEIFRLMAEMGIVLIPNPETLATIQAIIAKEAQS